MKISIGTKIRNGPWGGGNLFAINLKNYLESKGHLVYLDLSENDLDLILITEPRRTSESSAFTHDEINSYLKYVNSNTLVVHRINECDERKGTNYVNKYLIHANKVADATVFVSTWLKDLFIQNGLKNTNLNVILSGANSEIFNSSNKSYWNGLEPLKIVTHHWGANWNKGFEVYSKLDKYLSKNKEFEFTYIGNLPKNFTFKNSKNILPISGEELSSEIKKNHVYITASKFEPSGNHHIEAAQCGLPILYINSGGIPEYCDGFGIMFNTENLFEKLEEIKINYNYFEEKMKDYKFNSNMMCLEYEELFLKLLKNKDEIVSSRKILKDFKNQNRHYFNLKRKIYRNDIRKF